MAQTLQQSHETAHTSAGLHFQSVSNRPSTRRFPRPHSHRLGIHHAIGIGRSGIVACPSHHPGLNRVIRFDT
jgi:hypothetical protein